MFLFTFLGLFSLVTRDHITRVVVLSGQCKVDSRTVFYVGLSMSFYVGHTSYHVILVDPYYCRDFNGFDLRMRLPFVASILYKTINSNGGVTYSHCSVRLGRAPCVALAYMSWILGYKLGEASRLLQVRLNYFSF